MTEDEILEIFESARPRLMGLAYRILGSVVDAEDVVQDVFLKWRAAEKPEIENLQGWLTTVCTRQCLDVLKSAHKARVDYVGPWLPEPLQTQGSEELDRVELASTLSTAFLLLLERLTPKERVAYLLHEIFELSYDQVSETLGIEGAACRKLVSRARGHVGEDNKRTSLPSVQQHNLLSAFQVAIKTGDISSLKDMLSEDVVLNSDGGGKVLAARRPVVGLDKVLTFIEKILVRSWAQVEFKVMQVNGMQGLAFYYEAQLSGVITFSYRDDGRMDNIFIVRNPEKLQLFHSSNEGTVAMV